jgi:hypothetical protein
MLGWECNCAMYACVRVHTVKIGNQPAKITDDMSCSPFRFPVVDSLLKPGSQSHYRLAN